MKSKPTIAQQVEDTLASASDIQPVPAPPLFKDTILKQMAKQKIEADGGVHFLQRFAPQLQAAALLCLVVLNTLALLSGNDDADYGDAISEFAEEYGLSEKSTSYYLNENQ